MITKQVFVGAIKALYNVQNQLPDESLSGLVTMLEAAMDCRPEANGKTWIRWWIEDNNFGRNQLTVALGNHDEAVETPEELYDLLIFKKK